jgi:hypothetical protein
MSLKGQLSEFIYLHSHLYSLYIKVYIYILVKFCTFGFILKKYTTFATDMHFGSQCAITKVCLSHALLVYAVLTSVLLLSLTFSSSSELTFCSPHDENLTVISLSHYYICSQKYHYIHITPHHSHTSSC